jgi:putative flavoprotein involved in K+ transport
MAPLIHDVVIIGAGQAGLALSYHLGGAGVDHVILEQGRLGNAWREDRWDSFCLVTPNWTITLPGADYAGDHPDGFLSGSAFVHHLENWARSFAAPVREHVRAKRVTRDSERFIVETDQGALNARQVVIATASYQTPRTPPELAGLPKGVTVLAAAQYRNPGALAPGAVLVVGSGQSGCQIAEEVNTAGRETYLAVGRSGRLPRRYRGRDCIAWQRDMGLLDRTPDKLDDPAHRFRGDPHLSGGRGGYTLSLHDLHVAGVTLLGRVAGSRGTRLDITDNLSDSLAFADGFAADFRVAVDQHIGALGLAAPIGTAEEMLGEPPREGLNYPVIRELDLCAQGISTVILATGFDFDFSWIDFPVFDRYGYPITYRGSTTIPGLHFTGLNWMHKRKSGIIYGVAEDAGYLAERIGEAALRAGVLPQL